MKRHFEEKDCDESITSRKKPNTATSMNNSSNSLESSMADISKRNETVELDDEVGRRKRQLLLIQRLKRLKERYQEQVLDIEEELITMSNGEEKEKKQQELAEAKRNLAEAQKNLDDETRREELLLQRAREEEAHQIRMELAKVVLQLNDPRLLDQDRTRLNETEMKLRSILPADATHSAVVSSMKPVETLEDLQMIWETAQLMDMRTEFNVDDLRNKLGGIVNLSNPLPFVQGKIDMRYYYQPNRPRKAAQRLVERIQKRKPDVYYFVAVSGSGKTSAILEVARFHYVIYIQCTSPDEIEITSSGPRNRAESHEPDKSFIKFVTDYADMPKKSTSGSEAELLENWQNAKLRGGIELVARLMLLCRMYDDIFERENHRIVEPWEFMMQQQQDSDIFIAHCVKALESSTWKDVENLTENLTKYLIDKNVLGRSQKLVVAVDELETGTSIYFGRFHRVLNQPTIGKGIVSPLLHAIGDLQYFSGWSVVVAGTGSNHDRMDAIRSDIGKGTNEPKTLLNQNDFPMATMEDCCVMLSHHLLLSDEQVRLLQGLQQPPVNYVVDKYSKLPWYEIVSFYLVNARFRLLAGTFEKLVKNDQSIDEILRNALIASVNRHNEKLKAHILKTVDVKQQNKFDVRNRLMYLRQIYVGSMLSNGAISFPHEHNPMQAFTDLIALGIAGAEMRSDNQSEFYITERFVLDVIAEICKDDEFADLEMESLVLDLHNILIKYSSTTFKGNICERVFIQKMVDWGKKVQTIGQLPFVPKNLSNEWKDIYFQPCGIVESSDPKYIASSENVCISPEKDCRPDMILMLPKQPKDQVRRAITLGSAVYSCNVGTDKVTEQYRSTDMSRAYLLKNMDGVHVRGKREEWFNLGLHNVASIRLNVCLPVPVKGAVTKCKTTDKCGKAHTDGSLEIIKIFEPDVDIHLDMKSIKQLIGPFKESDFNQSLYRLLSVATNTKLEDWY